MTCHTFDDPDQSCALPLENVYSYRSEPPAKVGAATPAVAGVVGGMVAIGLVGACLVASKVGCTAFGLVGSWAFVPNVGAFAKPAVGGMLVSARMKDLPKNPSATANSNSVVPAPAANAMINVRCDDAGMV